jgi:hypothetical protein
VGPEEHLQQQQQQDHLGETGATVASKQQDNYMLSRSSVNGALETGEGGETEPAVDEAVVKLLAALPKR